MYNQQRQKRTHPKVRTGCTTCKARRIKCDEVKPVCSRCRLSNRKCIYAVPKTWIFAPQKETPVLLKGPLPITLGEHDERRAFDFFKQATVPQFAGRHDLQLRFWGNFIPQIAAFDILIFKLAVAMGSQHEAVVYGTPESSALAKRSHDAVVATLARNLTTLRVDISLLCCAMLMGYANLCEDVPATAAVHFSLGLRMLREETIPGHRNLTDSMGTFVEPMFGELELATALFGRPPEKVEIICPHTPTRPVLPSIFNDLYEAKQNLGGILRWLLWLTVLHRTAPERLTAESADVDVLLTQWRQIVVKYSLTIVATYPGLYMKARKMLFQYKLFGTCRGAANNPIFIETSRVRTLSVDFSQPLVTSVLCKLKRNIENNTWRPLAPKPARDWDDLDIWPHGEPVGHDGNTQIVRITLGR
ncbi:hypothetical protein LTR70_004799 [Exophiala xenobiotica]|uniref:Zn(2)-C6 fungal-type domain-containing protein n=1 Tax=Lithohypha guttulata TaxID=1690604 RepID=A0ABR0KCH0_9EURO|nr:hypothetical protein LTR24_004291 [Lithohypha guttulata]KAK5319889.1 hypothetical protein LTR70_004799 [Exophiala xenobiotica]